MTKINSINLAKYEETKIGNYMRWVEKPSKFLAKKQNEDQTC